MLAAHATSRARDLQCEGVLPTGASRDVQNTMVSPVYRYNLQAVHDLGFHISGVLEAQTIYVRS